MLAQRSQLMQGVVWVSNPEDRDAHLLALRRVPRSTPRFLTRQSELDLDLNISLSVYGSKHILCLLGQIIVLQTALGVGRQQCAWYMRVCGGVANERKGRSGKRLRTKPEAQIERALSIALKSFPPNAPVSLSGHSAQQSTHAAAGTQMCADCVDCMRVLLHLFYTLTTQHPGGPQRASTYRPLAQTTCTQYHHPREASLCGFESATYTQDMLARC